MGGFRGLDLTAHDLDDPKTQELINYINLLQNRSVKIDDIPLEYQEALVDLIGRRVD